MRASVSILTFCLVAVCAVPCNRMWGLWNPSQPWNGDNMASTAKLDNSLGRSSDLVHWYANWGDGSGDMSSWNVPKFINVAQNFVSVGQSQHVPLLTWQPWGPKFSVSPAEYPLTSVASGQFDTYINTWVNYLSTLNTPVFLRPFHEFDGTWYPWGNVNGNTPAQFIAAWRHVRSLFSGAKNVYFVWCPNNSNQAGVDQMQYYPGDQYVDWVGIDAYSDNGASFMQTITTYCNPPNLYGRITAVTSKPIMIAEFGVVQGQGVTQAAWLRQALADVESRLPQIKAMVYFNQYGYSFNTTASDYNTIASALGGCAPSQALSIYTSGQQPATSSSSSSSVTPSSSAPSNPVISPAPAPQQWSGPSPILYYSFDTVSTTVTDQSNSGSTGTLSGPGASSTAGIYGNAINLDQSQGLTTVQVNNGQNLVGPFTVATWVNLPSAMNVRMKVAASKTQWDGATGWQLEIFPSGNSISFVGGGGSVAFWSITHKFNVFFHVAVSVTQNSAELFYNGVSQGAIYITPVSAAQQPLTVASDGLQADGVTGALDEFYIFGSALTASQINGVMNNQVYTTKQTVVTTTSSAVPPTSSSIVAPTTSSIPPTTSSTVAPTTSSIPKTSSILKTSSIPPTTSSTVAPTTSSVPRTSSSTVAPTSSTVPKLTTSSTLQSTSSVAPPPTTSSTVPPSSVAKTTSSSQAAASSSPAAPSCGSNNPCGAALCCPSRAGNQCYSSGSYTCTADIYNGYYNLCGYANGKPNGSCNGGCFDSTMYTCSSTTGQLSPK